MITERNSLEDYVEVVVAAGYTGNRARNIARAVKKKVDFEISRWGVGVIWPASLTRIPHVSSEKADAIMSQLIERNLALSHDEARRHHKAQKTAESEARYGKLMTHFPSFVKQYQIELAVIAAVLLSVFCWGHMWSTLQALLLLVWVGVLYVMAHLARIDHSTGLIPDTVLGKRLLPLAILYVTLDAITSFGTLWSALLGLLLLGGLAYTLFQVSTARWIGGGSVKLLFLSGLLVGLHGALYMLGIIIVGIVALNIATRRRSFEMGWLIFASLVIAKVATQLF